MKEHVVKKPLSPAEKGGPEEYAFSWQMTEQDWLDFYSAFVKKPNTKEAVKQLRAGQKPLYGRISYGPYQIGIVPPSEEDAWRPEYEVYKEAATEDMWTGYAIDEEGRRWNRMELTSTLGAVPINCKKFEDFRSKVEERVRAYVSEEPGNADIAFGLRKGISLEAEKRDLPEEAVRNLIAAHEKMPADKIYRLPGDYNISAALDDLREELTLTYGTAHADTYWNSIVETGKKKRGRRRVQTESERKASQAESVVRYERDNTKRYGVKFNNKTDAEIISRLDSESNKQGYLKFLIKQDIAVSPLLRTLAKKETDGFHLVDVTEKDGVRRATVIKKDDSSCVEHIQETPDGTVHISCRDQSEKQ